MLNVIAAAITPATTPISIPMAISTVPLLAWLSAAYRGSHPALDRRTGYPESVLRADTRLGRAVD
jgi:hypothetical protein